MKKKQYFGIVLLVASIITTTKIFSYAELTSLPEFSGIAKVASSAPNSSHHPQNIFSTEKIDPLTLVETAYSLQLEALNKKSPHHSLNDTVIYEALALHYALRYLETLPHYTREAYKQTIKTTNPAKYLLLLDYEAIRNNKNEREKLAEALIKYLTHLYPENTYLLTSAESIRNILTNTLPLAIPTHILLTLGGDDRLLVTPETKTNKYLTSPIPFSHIAMRSSCTNSYPTQKAFDNAENARLNLLIKTISGEGDEAYMQAMKQLRLRILKALAIDDIASEVQTILTPSGTTSEMIVTLLALMRNLLWKPFTQLPHETLVTNIITAAGEVGTGTPDAAKACHFSHLVPRGDHVTNTNPLEGIPTHCIELVQLPARENTSGALADTNQQEQQIENLLHKTIHQEKRIAVLHLVHSSKTGIITPSLNFAVQMKKKFQDSLIIIVDTAQLRCTPATIKKYLQHDFCVFVTGSKFFAGSPFSGAIFLPHQEASIFIAGNQLIPQGFGQYFTKEMVDDRLTSLQQQLPSWKNYGLLLRWETALSGMEDFTQLDSQLKNQAITLWSKGVEEIILNAKHVYLLNHYGENFGIKNEPTMIAESKTIIPLALCPLHEQTNKEEPALKPADLQLVHKWLTLDISSKLPTTATNEEKQLASQQFLIGQPVAIANGTNGFGIIRIALSAPIVTQMVHRTITRQITIEDAVSDELKIDAAIVKKLTLIAKYFYWLKKGSNLR